MPRGAKKTANQHNNRHENGIVAPGKRITKQKSNGHINGYADGSPQPKTPPPASAAVSRSHVPDRRAIESKNAFADVEDFESRDSGDASDESGLPVNDTSNALSDGSHRKIDVNATKNPTVHDSSPLNLAITILRSCPLGDTIAILIFLLSLPPTFLTLTNTLFAVLTFMPPATSISSFPSTFNEIFQGSNGAPSLATVVITDILGLVLWLVVWPPMQVLALELSQAVVAATLGGGNSMKHEGWDHTVGCLLVVVGNHVARRTGIRHRFFDYDWTIRLASISSSPLVGQAEYFSDNSRHDRTFAGWIATLVTLHVFVQGIVRVVRRWIAKRGHNPPLSPIKRTDLDTVTGSPARSDAVLPVIPTNLAGSSQEPINKSSLPNARELKEKSSKRRRRLGTSVRSQQPLWAAFAATKVTVCREFDQSKMLQEASGSNATDLRNLGDAPFALEEGRVWITSIHLSSFSFEASHFPQAQPEPSDGEFAKLTAGVGVDRSKPFFVRINGADWSSTVIRSLFKEEPEGVSADQHWEGEVFGLSPSSSYICSFVRCEDGVEIYSTSISTPSSSPPDQETSASVASPSQAHRPSSPMSPATTLRNSIAACEANLIECQARQKRCKKDNKAASATLKKEIDIQNGKIAKIAVDDKAHQNRHMQWTQQSRQADKAVAIMSNDLEVMGSVPKQDQQQWTTMKGEWEAERKQRSNAHNELSSCKESAHHEKSAVQGEASNIQQKRERLAARAAKLHEQRQRLHSANAQGLDEKERREAELAAKAADRRQFDKGNQTQITNIERSYEILQQNILQARHQVQGYIEAYNQQQLMNASIGDSPIPEVNVPETPFQPSASPAFGFSGLGQVEKGSARSRSAPFRHENRPRSSSLLSNNSEVQNDFDDQDPAPPMPMTKAASKAKGRNRSGGSGANGGVRLSPANSSGSTVWN